MKTIALFGAGRSSAILIDYLIRSCQKNGWMLMVADINPSASLGKTGDSAFAVPVTVDANDPVARRKLIEKANLVISLLPPNLHILLAEDCLELGKNLLTASYTDPRLRKMDSDIRRKGLLFLCEMGLDPGIDHMSALRLIARIRKKGGSISSFKSHCGGLVAPESDDNNWHYKVSWNPRNVVMAGKDGAQFRENGQSVKIPYAAVFENCREVQIPEFGTLACYPNRDSLAYIPLYDLEEAATFLRTTLRFPAFCRAWQAIVKAGLTNDHPVDTAGRSFKEWSQALIQFITPGNEAQLRFLGLLDESPVPDWASSSAAILQYLVESKLTMRPEDRDLVIMHHELEYQLEGKPYNCTSTLVVKGEDSRHTAMAKTVGLPLGIAAAMVLQEKIPLTGLHIPIQPEIYLPVLEELAREGIIFSEEEKSVNHPA